MYPQENILLLLLKSSLQSHWTHPGSLEYIQRLKIQYWSTSMWVSWNLPQRMVAHNLISIMPFSETWNAISWLKFCFIDAESDRYLFHFFTMRGLCLIWWQVKWADGKRFEDRFVETLKKYGYKGSYLSKDWLKQPAFIQSFAPTSLIYVSNLTDLPKIFLIDDITVPTQDTNQVCVLSSFISLETTYAVCRS